MKSIIVNPVHKDVTLLECFASVISTFSTESSYVNFLHPRTLNLTYYTCEKTDHYWRMKTPNSFVYVPTCMHLYEWKLTKYCKLYILCTMCIIILIAAVQSYFWFLKTVILVGAVMFFRYPDAISFPWCPTEHSNSIPGEWNSIAKHWGMLKNLLLA